MTTYPKNSKQRQYRELRSIHRELNLLDDAIFKLPKLKLDKPRFVGYKRFYVLRDDITRRKDVKIFRDILLLLNSFVYSKTKDFSKYDIDNLPFHFKQSIKSLSEKQFEKIDEKFKKYFVRFKHWDFRKSEIRYEFIHPYYFILKIKQHNITEVPMLDTKMESRISEIRERLNRDFLYIKIDKFLYGHYKHNEYYEKSMREKLESIFDMDMRKQIEGE